MKIVKNKIGKIFLPLFCIALFSIPLITAVPAASDLQKTWNSFFTLIEQSVCPGNNDLISLTIKDQQDRIARIEFLLKTQDQSQPLITNFKQEFSEFTNRIQAFTTQFQYGFGIRHLGILRNIFEAFETLLLAKKESPPSIHLDVLTESTTFVKVLLKNLLQESLYTYSPSYFFRQLKKNWIHSFTVAGGSLILWYGVHQLYEKYQIRNLSTELRSTKKDLAATAHELLQHFAPYHPTLPPDIRNSLQRLFTNTQNFNIVPTDFNQHCFECTKQYNAIGRALLARHKQLAAILKAKYALLQPIKNIQAKVMPGGRSDNVRLFGSFTFDALFLRARQIKYRLVLTNFKNKLNDDLARRLTDFNNKSSMILKAFFEGNNANLMRHYVDAKTLLESVSTDESMKSKLEACLVNLNNLQAAPFNQETYRTQVEQTEQAITSLNQEFNDLDDEVKKLTDDKEDLVDDIEPYERFLFEDACPVCLDSYKDLLKKNNDGQQTKVIIFNCCKKTNKKPAGRHICEPCFRGMVRNNNARCPMGRCAWSETSILEKISISQAYSILDPLLAKREMS